MKRILGLDLGTNSIGWALVNEAENDNELSSIVKLGVRVNPLTTDEQTNFEKGKSITTTADRTLKRGARLNLHRYKLRRQNLIETLKRAGFISDDSILSEDGNFSTFQTWRLRAKAATERIELCEFARVLLAINKKRGYKSSRKATSKEDGVLIDGMYVAKRLYDENMTPGELVHSLLSEGKNFIPTFYRSDLQAEFDKVWATQSQFYPDILTNDFKETLRNKTKALTSDSFVKRYNIYQAENKGKDKRIQAYAWRTKAIKERLSIEEVAFILCEINGAIASSSGYLGAIGDRSKELFFNNQTVGQYLMAKLDANPNYSLKNKVFYRQDYLNEFETIWECQSKYHQELTAELKHEIRDIIIFYQRNLKSQKGLISFCEFESHNVEIRHDGTTKTKQIGHRVAPRSSLIFQEFKIWQYLNNIEVKNKNTEDKRLLNEDEKQQLFEELWYRDKMTKTDVLKLLFKNAKELDLNYKELDGNKTLAVIYDKFMQIVALSGHENVDINKVGASKTRKLIFDVFSALGFNTEVLNYESELPAKQHENQLIFKLWHLLYSFESDSSATGNEKLKHKISKMLNMPYEYASLLANTTFQTDYSSLSTKAMSKILPFLKQGLQYDVACEMAGYKHSKQSLTKEELANKTYKDKLDILPKNSLRNPVVEKIINQMIHVVNGVISTYGKPDEIRIELARDLKRSAAERESMTKIIAQTTKEHEKIKNELQKEFGLSYVSRNDIIRYKLYEELKSQGYKTLYSNRYIPREKLFSKEIDIEHIIPQSKLFNDSFANKTLEYRDVNLEKGDSTAADYVKRKYGEEHFEKYKQDIKDLSTSEAKKNNLLTTENEIPSDFINRDLRDTQYISRKAREILLDIVPQVVSTTGSITDRLREDWQLINVMQELNWDKYNRIGMTYYEINRDNKRLPRIKDWTKRNDHRHHAMDALTIAFTKPSYIQYINNLNARSDKSGSINAIEHKELYRDDKGKLRFKAPIPLAEFRREAKLRLNDILISFKAKNKVVTRQTNITKRCGDVNKKIELTPRGPLHNDTIYGKSYVYEPSEKKITSLSLENIHIVANKRERDIIKQRLIEFDGNSEKAFTGKNSLDKNPIYYDDAHTVKISDKVKCVTLEPRFTIRKAVTPDLKIDKVIDRGIKTILQDRLNQFEGNAQKAFSNLEENPIWLNKEKGIQIKRVAVAGVRNVEALHDKRDKNGNFILDKQGKKQPVDFVSTNNNHHVAIFQDKDGNLQECIVSMFEATQRAVQHKPVIDKTYKYEDGWRFLFTLKQNEYFIFPQYETITDENGDKKTICTFNPNDIDLMNPDNYALISPNLFRVQKLSSKYYCFRHHLETTVEEKKELKGITWKRITALDNLKDTIKVRIDHIGRIVGIGEY